MCREHCMPSLMCLTERTLATPVFKYFWHSQTGYLGTADGVKSCHSHMCPTAFLHRLSIHATDKGNSIALCSENGEGFSLKFLRWNSRV